MSDNSDEYPIFECPVCLETENDPFILPSCGHSFCRACIEKLKRDSNQKKQKGIVCSLCRTKCLNIEEIRKNYALIDLKQRYYKKRREKMNKEPISARSTKLTSPIKATVMLKFSNGDRYEGEVNSTNKMHGVGTYFYTNGDKYVGDWIEDNQTGKGTYYWKDGDRYEGEYKNNKKNGFGVYYYANGEKYEGEWLNDLKNGLGKMFYFNTDEYMGNFFNDKRHGFGNYVCGDEIIRKLINLLNLSETSGNEINLNGVQSYSGDWVEDKRTGYGRLIMMNGNKYEGDFLNGKKNGKGVLYYKSGDKYIGDWANESITGHGKLYWKNGERFEGKFKNGNLNGFGTFYFADGRILRGLWDTNKSMEPKLTQSEKFWGSNVFAQNEQYLREKLKKEVTFHYEDGTRFEGEQAVDTKKPHRGKLFWPNGDYYDGEFVNGKMSGNGKIVRANK